MPSLSATPSGHRHSLPEAAHALLRAALLLLAACLALQGLAVSAQRAQGPGHYHSRTQATLSTAAAEAALQRHGTAALPFGGRLRSHPATEFHSEVEHHSHDAGMAGVVTLGEDGSALLSAAWAAIVQSALDLPGLLMQPGAVPAVPLRGAWPDGDSAAFASQATTPLLRPPRH